MSTAGAPQMAVSTWKIDSAHTVAEFKVKHMMITNVKGQFSGVSGTLSLDEKDATNSKVEVTIPTATVNTREPDRDTHLKSPDFFDVEKFPTLSFRSTSVIRRRRLFSVRKSLLVGKTFAECWNDGLNGCRKRG